MNKERDRAERALSGILQNLEKAKTDALVKGKQEDAALADLMQHTTEFLGTLAINFVFGDEE